MQPSARLQHEVAGHVSDLNGRRAVPPTVERQWRGTGGATYSISSAAQDRSATEAKGQNQMGRWRCVLALQTRSLRWKAPHAASPRGNGVGATRTVSGASITAQQGVDDGVARRVPSDLGRVLRPAAEEERH